MNPRNQRTKEVNKIVGTIQAFDNLKQSLGNQRDVTNGYRGGASSQLNRILPITSLATFGGGSGGSSTVG